MSWLYNPEGDRPTARTKRTSKPPTATTAAADTATDGPRTQPEEPGSPWGEFPLKDEYPKVHDPVDHDRMVSTKQANRPFLAYSEYRQKREKEHQAWLQRKEERDEKLARGEEVGPEEPDPTAEPEVGCLGLLKFLLYALVFIVLAGKFFTGSFLWEQELPDLRQWIPTNERLFSESMLATFDGTREGQPIYLAIDGDVYDVSSNRRTYGPGGSYHRMAGVDAARAYATGCFATHRTHDIRGLNERELQSVAHWKKFYAESKKYPKVGRVSHPPIDPMSPIPEHCDPEKARKAAEEEAKAKEKQAGHDEL